MAGIAPPAMVQHLPRIRVVEIGPTIFRVRMQRQNIEPEPPARVRGHAVDGFENVGLPRRGIAILLDVKDAAGDHEIGGFGGCSSLDPPTVAVLAMAGTRGIQHLDRNIVANIWTAVPVLAEKTEKIAIAAAKIGDTPVKTIGQKMEELRMPQPLRLFVPPVHAARRRSKLTQLPRVVRSRGFVYCRGRRGRRIG